jgi:hypothetical protein
MGGTPDIGLTVTAFTWQALRLKETISLVTANIGRY